jgi:hypothetical protein
MRFVYYGDAPPGNAAVWKDSQKQAYARTIAQNWASYNQQVLKEWVVQFRNLVIAWPGLSRPERDQNRLVWSETIHFDPLLDAGHKRDLGVSRAAGAEPPAQEAAAREAAAIKEWQRTHPSAPMIMSNASHQLFQQQLNTLADRQPWAQRS